MPTVIVRKSLICDYVCAVALEIVFITYLYRIQIFKNVLVDYIIRVTLPG
jgi:hypothetical protein